MMSGATRRILFKYPELPIRELRFYIFVITCGTLYGWYLVYNASSRFKFKAYGRHATIHQLPLFGYRFKVIFL